ncbi:MAG: hypothetical protein ACK4QW_15885 [Alphaproteobacteria bacterium]
MATGVLAVWTDVDPAAEAEFDDWYNRQHLPERVAVPGFRSGQRYRCLGDGPRYLAWYETDGPDALRSAAYRARLDGPTPWTRKIMPAFRDTVRSVFVAPVRFGAGRGGYAATVRPVRAAEPLAVAEAGLARLIDLPGVIGVQWWRLADFAGEAADTAETAMRGRDRVAPEAVLIEATDPEPLDRACAALAIEPQAAQVDRYRLLYALAHAEAEGG